MQKLVRSVVTLVTLLAFVTCAYGREREVILYTDAMRVEERDDQQVWLLSSFRIESEEYTLRAERGEFIPKDEWMQAEGTSERPIVLERLPGEKQEAFVVTAQKLLQIHFDDERLFAQGEVSYVSQGTNAVSDTIWVEDRDVIRSAIDELVQSIRDPAALAIVLDFFDDLPDDARLVLLRGNVRVEREDATLKAAWMVFDESNTERFISAAHPDQPLEMRVLLGDEEN